MPKPDVISDLWYKNAILYNCDVRTYMDSNGDGVGDFEGLKRRLDYLHGLGITALWLMPFYPSPDRDDGYDISDYYGIDPRYGTLGEFVEFAHAAERSAPLVQGGAVVEELALSRLVCLVAEAAARLEPGHGLSGRAEVDLDQR
jgi:hypothetical protein